MDIASQLAIAFLLVLLNGFFVAAEFALVKVRSTRITELARDGKASTRMALHTLRHLDIYLSASQVGISIASIALGRVGEPAVSALLRPALHNLHVPEGGIEALSFTLALAVVTAVHIVIGEQAPKSYAIQNPESVSLGAALPLHGFYWLFRPAIWLLNAASNLTLKLLRIPAGSDHSLAHSQEELSMILTASHESGVLKESEVDLVKQVFEFADKVASDIMVPRVDMVYLDATEPLEKNLEVMRSHTYTRYPLCEGDPDHPIGMVHIKDLVRIAGTRGDIRTIRREMLYVPETKSIDRLLREFQWRKLHMAIVVDEFGGTAGLLTLEDILEQIVGEIHDEFEEPVPEVQELEPGQWLIDGRAPLLDLRADYSIELPEGEPDTVGGWVLDRAGAIPSQGEQFDVDGYAITVREMDGPRVRKVLIQRTAAVEHAEHDLE